MLVVHGGPGAPGTMETVARALSRRYRALEPLQRGSGSDPLSVSRHVADLHEVVTTRCRQSPHIVGHSWGAMLALAYAAAHPGAARTLVLVGSGTFDIASRSRMKAIRDERMTAEIREQIATLSREIADPDTRLRKIAEVSLPLDSFDLVSPAELCECDARAHEETWNDMVRLQEAGVYPARFDAIECPVTMLHGAVDPHPGTMIRDSLRPPMPQLEYHEWQDCGHYPWLERAVGDEFYAILEAWLDRH